MSIGSRIPFAEARDVALKIGEQLQPHVVRMNTAGSLRRRRLFVSDLEIVAEPRLVTTDLFGGTKHDIASIKSAIETIGRFVKGREKYLQFTDICGIEGLKLDLFLVTPPANYWSILAIRTGPAELGHFAVTRMRDHGYRHEEGRILDRHGREAKVESEPDFFFYAGLPYLPPAQRDSAEARTPLPASSAAIAALREACL